MDDLDKQKTAHNDPCGPMCQHQRRGQNLRSYISNNALQARSRLEGLLVPRRQWTETRETK